MLIESFLIYLQHEKRYSHHTITAYRTDLLQFVDFLKHDFNISTIEAKATHV